MNRGSLNTVEPALSSPMQVIGINMTTANPPPKSSSLFSRYFQTVKYADALLAIAPPAASAGNHKTSATTPTIAAAPKPPQPSSNSKLFPVHRVVLAAQCKYLEDLFESPPVKYDAVRHIPSTLFDDSRSSSSDTGNDHTDEDDTASEEDDSDVFEDVLEAPAPAPPPALVTVTSSGPHSHEPGTPLNNKMGFGPVDSDSPTLISPPSLTSSAAKPLVVNQDVAAAATPKTLLPVWTVSAPTNDCLMKVLEYIYLGTVSNLDLVNAWSVSKVGRQMQLYDLVAKVEGYLLTALESGFAHGAAAAANFSAASYCSASAPPNLTRPVRSIKEWVISMVEAIRGEASDGFLKKVVVSAVFDIDVVEARQQRKQTGKDRAVYATQEKLTAPLTEEEMQLLQVELPSIACASSTEHLLDDESNFSSDGFAPSHAFKCFQFVRRVIAECDDVTSSASRHHHHHGRLTRQEVSRALTATVAFDSFSLAELEILQEDVRVPREVMARALMSNLKRRERVKEELRTGMKVAVEVAKKAVIVGAKRLEMATAQAAVPAANVTTTEASRPISPTGRNVSRSSNSSSNGGTLKQARRVTFSKETGAQFLKAQKAGKVEESESAPQLDEPTHISHFEGNSHDFGFAGVSIISPIGTSASSSQPRRKASADAIYLKRKEDVDDGNKTIRAVSVADLRSAFGKGRGEIEVPQQKMQTESTPILAELASAPVFKTASKRVRKGLSSALFAGANDSSSPAPSSPSRSSDGNKSGVVKETVLPQQQPPEPKPETAAAVVVTQLDETKPNDVPTFGSSSTIPMALEANLTKDILDMSFDVADIEDVSSEDNINMNSVFDKDQDSANVTAILSAADVANIVDGLQTHKEEITAVRQQQVVELIPVPLELHHTSMNLDATPTTMNKDMQPAVVSKPEIDVIEYQKDEGPEAPGVLQLVPRQPTPELLEEVAEKLKVILEEQTKSGTAVDEDEPVSPVVLGEPKESPVKESIQVPPKPPTRTSSARLNLIKKSASHAKLKVRPSLTSLNEESESESEEPHTGHGNDAVETTKSLDVWKANMAPKFEASPLLHLPLEFPPPPPTTTVSQNSSNNDADDEIPYRAPQSHVSMIAQELDLGPLFRPRGYRRQSVPLPESKPKLPQHSMSMEHISFESAPQSFAENIADSEENIFPEPLPQSNASQSVRPLQPITPSTLLTAGLGSQDHNLASPIMVAGSSTLLRSNSVMQESPTSETGDSASTLLDGSKNSPPHVQNMSLEDITFSTDDSIEVDETTVASVTPASNNTAVVDKSASFVDAETSTPRLPKAQALNVNTSKSNIAGMWRPSAPVLVDTVTGTIGSSQSPVSIKEHEQQQYNKLIPPRPSVDIYFNREALERRDDDSFTSSSDHGNSIDMSFSESRSSSLYRSSPFSLLSLGKKFMQKRKK